jgi:NADPH-dependent 2,4-dienoyl-CoA reductase/sulfur reductase-like enzyme
MDRRAFLIGSVAALTALPNSGWALNPPMKPKARVIVVGGGMGGATVAKYIRLWGDDVAVTLVERNVKYVSSIMSSLVLTGQRTIPNLTFGYDTLRNRYGIEIIIDDVAEVDPTRAAVKLTSGKQLTADRIVMAPGIDFEGVPGLDSTRMPHAWKAGVQTELLAEQLRRMPENGVVVLTVPKAPYRCPPGPYERACLIADWLKTTKPRAKLILLDANPDIAVEKEIFARAFTGPYAKVIEYRSSQEIISANSLEMTLSTNAGPVRGDVINMIPPHRAGSIVAASGLITSSNERFAPVDVLSYSSKVAPNVHVIGDSCATTQPKAGHIANQEAKVCADALARIFSGGQPDPSPVTNSACYSTISRTEATWLNAVFQFDAATKSMVAVPKSVAASQSWTADNFKDMGNWFDALMTDTFA